MGIKANKNGSFLLPRSIHGVIRIATFVVLLNMLNIMWASLCDIRVTMYIHVCCVFDGLIY